jgi:ubiquinone/menaquinone biosynthesis C-methylase UbiE
MSLPFAQLSFPEIYEQALVGPLFRPWVEPMLDEVELRSGDRILDVACGTGIVARLAKERLAGTGKVVGVDLSAGMLAVARRVEPAIDWREGDAGALPLPDDEQFDVVVSQQGLQFFADRPAAVRQMRRALAADGRLAVSTWRPEEECPVLLELRHVAERHVGALVDRRHSLGEADQVETLLRAAGFRGVRSKTISKTIRFDDGSVFVRLNAMALVGMSAASRGMSDVERGQIVAAIVHDSADVIRRRADETEFVFEISTNVTTARAPRT